MSKRFEAMQQSLSDTEKKLGIVQKSSELGQKTAQTLSKAGEGSMMMMMIVISISLHTKSDVLVIRSDWRKDKSFV
jgi:hypothetical protein